MQDEILNVHIDWDSLKLSFSTLSHSGLFTLLVTLIAVDFITGTFHAFVTKELDSSIGSRGLMKHSTILILATVIGVVLDLMRMDVLANTFMTFYIAEYSLSIIENAVGIGVPFPNKWKQYFVQIRDEDDEVN